LGCHTQTGAVAPKAVSAPNAFNPTSSPIGSFGERLLGASRRYPATNESKGFKAFFSQGKFSPMRVRNSDQTHLRQ
jgi:hypothetical protein